MFYGETNCEEKIKKSNTCGCIVLYGMKNRKVNDRSLRTIAGQQKTA